MGGTTSKSTFQQLTDISTDVTTKTIMSCSTAATQNQMISLQNVKGDVNISGVNMNQGASINMSCIMSTDMQSQISTQVAAAIAQTAESKGQAVLSALGRTKSEAQTNIQTMIRNNITNVTQSDISASISQSQSITAANVGGNVVIANVSMEQSAKIVAQALMSTSAYQVAINDSATKMDQSSKSTEENPVAGIIKSIGSAISSVMSAPIMIIGGIILFIVLIIIIFKFVFKRS